MFDNEGKTNSVKIVLAKLILEKIFSYVPTHQGLILIFGYAITNGSWIKKRKDKEHLHIREHLIHT